MAYESIALLYFKGNIKPFERGHISISTYRSGAVVYKCPSWHRGIFAISWGLSFLTHSPKQGLPGTITIPWKRTLLQVPWRRSWSTIVRPFILKESVFSFLSTGSWHASDWSKKETLSSVLFSRYVKSASRVSW